MSSAATETAVTLIQLVRFCSAHDLGLPADVLHEAQTGCALGVAELALRAPGDTLAAVALSPWQTAVDAGRLRSLWAAGGRAHGRELAVECAHVGLEDARSIVTFACLGAAHLRGALERMVRFWPLATTAFSWRLETRRRQTVAATYPDVRSPGDRMAVEFLVANLVHSGRGLTAEEWAPREVRLPYAPPLHVRKRMEELCAAEVRSGYPRLEIVFENDDLHRPVVPLLPEPFLRVVTGLAEDALGERRTARFADTVRIVVEEHLERGRISAGEVAELCGVSLRSFHRHLEAEGTSYKRLLDGALLARAEAMLVDERRTLADVARALGFADASSLHRAFRRWTGATPHRHRLAQG